MKDAVFVSFESERYVFLCLKKETVVFEIFKVIFKTSFPQIVFHAKIVNKI